MKNMTRNLAATGVAAVTATSALLAGTGPAAAAGQHVHRTGSRAAAAAAHHPSPRPAPHRRVDPWVMDQLRVFDPAAAHRLAVYDPWVKDQLAWLAGQKS
ncbi:hypothetical protein [Streptomyces sp. NPDC087512]|uniref:hypothetical protein n=1 Tax=unclassified Streptomyces TaxID=2593676 RepID=UPI0034253197